MGESVVAQQEREILRNWAYLPYRQFVTHSENAVELFLDQFHISREQTFQCNGELFLYTEGAKVAGVRHLAGESKILQVLCGRLEPLAVTSGHELNQIEIERTASFLSNILKRTAMLDHLSTPVSAADTNAQLALNAVGFRLADTILGYHLDLKDVSDEEPEDPCVRPASDDDVEYIARIAARCFSDRSLSVNRFNSEPLFAASDVGDLYASWTRGAVVNGQADLTLVYNDGSAPAGFMTFKIPSQRERAFGLSMGRAVLSAVDPECQKRGIYRSLLDSGCRWLKRNGVQSVEGKTQLSTVPVHRVWQSIGATLQVAYHTYHYRRN